jgi:hypothetical protein
VTGEDPTATTAVVADPAARGPASGPPVLAIFGGLLTLVILSMGMSALLLAGAGRVTFTEPAPTSAPPLVAPGGTVAPGATGSSERVRVVSATGASTPTGAGAHRVTFTWTLDGARENDPVEIHFYVGSQLAGRETGTLDASVFSFSSGILTLVTEQACSTAGWSADLVSVRGVLVDGDGIAVVRGAACN